MPPLVEKWKSIQRELEDEEREESDEEELNPQQRIQEWKMQQLLTYGSFIPHPGNACIRHFYFASQVSAFYLVLLLLPCSLFEHPNLDLL